MNEQVNRTFQTCKFQLNRISKIRKYLNQSPTKLLVNSLVLSRLDFQNSLLYGTSEKNIKKLNLIINSSIRLIYKLNKRTHLKEYYNKLNILPVKKKEYFISN